MPEVNHRGKRCVNSGPATVQDKPGFTTALSTRQARLHNSTEPAVVLVVVVNLVY